MIHVLPHLALFPYTTLFRSDALFATGDEDQGGHARGDHQQHRDLPEGVPDTGVDQGHVDHVVAAADLVGGFDQAGPQGLAVAGVGHNVVNVTLEIGRAHV